MFDGREANHQYSKSLGFEAADRLDPARCHRRRARLFLAAAPLFRSPDRLAVRAQTQASTTCFRAATATSGSTGHDGPLWCGECPKCHFVFLIFAPFMAKDRLLSIFGKNLLDDPANERLVPRTDRPCRPEALGMRRRNPRGRRLPLCADPAIPTGRRRRGRSASRPTSERSIWRATSCKRPMAELMTDSARPSIPPGYRRPGWPPMRFEEPVLLYGAGREARSTRAFLSARSPNSRSSSPSTAARPTSTTPKSSPRGPAGRHPGASLRHHRQKPRRVALPARLRRRPRGRHRGHLQPQPLGRSLSRRPHRHRHHRHQGQIDHRDAGPPDADHIRARCGPRRQCRACRRSRSPTGQIVVSSSSRATRPPTWLFRPTSPRSPISIPSMPTGTARSSATIATSST